MAIGVTALANINDTTNTSSYSSGSFTPSASELLVCLASVARGSSTNPAATLTLTNHDGGTAWTQIDEFLFETDATTRHRLYVYACITGASPGAAVLTIGVTASGVQASIFEISGADEGNGLVQTFVQTANTVADSSGTTAAVTLSAAGHSDNRSFAWWTHLANEATNALNSWVAIHDNLGIGSPSMGSESQWLSSSFDTTPDTSWTTSSVYGGIGFEVKAAASAAVVIPPLYQSKRTIRRYI